MRRGQLLGREVGRFDRRPNLHPAISNLQCALLLHLRAAGLLYRLGFHQLHPCEGGVVKIQLPLAVSANLRLFFGLKVML